MMLATDTKTIPKGDWVWETKYDGIRAKVHKCETFVEIFSRSGKNITERFPEIVKAALEIENDYVIDGEIVIFDKKGISDFNAISKRTHLTDKTKIKIRSSKDPAILMAFDLLEFNGKNYENAPFCIRKSKLIDLLVDCGPRIRYVSYSNCGGISEFLKEYKKTGVEGVIFKQPMSVYEDRRSKTWLKYKFKHEIDVAINKVELNPAGKKLYCDNDLVVQCSGRQSEAVKAGMIITVEYLNMTKNGKYRMPVYKKIVR